MSKLEAALTSWLHNWPWSLGYLHVVGTDLVIVRPLSYCMDFGTAY
jgi:hypothetical protein